MRALTIWQPWASLIVGGWKPYEFRPRAAPLSLVGKPLVIHAGARKAKPDEIATLMHELRMGENCGGLLLDCLPFLERVSRDPDCIPYSAGIGVVQLGKSVLSSELWPGEYANDSDRADKANWALPMLDVKPFQHPVPMRGHQGWWPWPFEKLPL